MNDTELATKMLQYGDLKRALEVLEAQIQIAVLERGKTQTVGSVRASYSAGRKSYDYRGALLSVDDVALSPWTTDVPATVKIDYREACLGLGIESVPFTQSEPSVTVKLI